MNDTIERMAKADYEHRARSLAVPARWAVRPARWEELPPELRASLYDAMWHALHELRNVSDVVIHEGAYCEQRSSPMPGTRDSWVAMIDKLLEVK